MFRPRQEEAALSAVVERGESPSAQPERMAVVLESARFAIAQEFQIAERLDAKSRNQVAVGGAWYALVQAAASIAIKVEIDEGGHTLLFAILISLAVVSGLALAASIVFSYDVWKLRDEREITHESLAEMAAVARNPDADIFDELVQHYAFILSTRRKNNKRRAESFKRSIPLWIVSLLLGLAELVVALAVVAQS